MHPIGITRFALSLQRALDNRIEDGKWPGAIPPTKYFVTTFELVPGRLAKGRVYNRILNFAHDAAKDKRLHALSITENAGGNPALSPGVLGREVLAMGMEPIIHFSCKDKNRNQIESHLCELDRYNLRNLLVMSGDYPRYGFKGQAKPVFDIDSVHLLLFISAIKKGIILDDRAVGGGQRLRPMNFFAGCVFSPFKRLEAELIPQYLKLERKIRAGALFAITQMGFDIRKYDEARRFLKIKGYRLPLLGTVMVPNAPLARVLHAGQVPGCILPESLMRKIEIESKYQDKGKKARLERAAKQIALLMAIGYEGVHLSGPALTYDDVVWMLDEAKRLMPKWNELIPEFLYPDCWDFWYFLEDKETRLNKDEPSLLGPASLGLISRVDLFINRFIHYLLFEPNSPFFKVMVKLCRSIQDSSLEEAFTWFEHQVKGALYGCQRCGDCALDELAFLCPQFKCAKFMLNGPCGGSLNGWCEVWPQRRKCFYVSVYERLKVMDKIDFLSSEPIPPRDWSLYRKASWLTFFLGQDHHAKKKDFDRIN